MIAIDYQSRKPIYEQIIERVSVLIMKGILPPDSQLPSVRSLAVELAINPNTIQKAYAVLEEQGYIYAVKGRGNFVADCSGLVEQKQKELTESFGELIAYAKAFGMTKETCIEIVESCWKEERQHD